MSVVESIGVALFMMLVVFLVLCVLFLLIKLFSGIVGRIERSLTRR